MKKKLLVGMMMALVLALGGCGSSETTDMDTTVISSEKKENKKDNKKKLDENDLVRSENVYLFASTIRTGTPNQITGINSKLTTLPVTEEALNGLGQYEVDTFMSDDYLASFTEMIDHVDNRLHIWEEKKSELESKEGPDIMYYTHNVNGDDLTFKRDMFDQGYWYLETELDDIKKYPLWNDTTFKWERFEHYIEVLGNPSYIRVYKDKVDRLKNEGAKYFDNIVDEKYDEYNEKDDDERDSFFMLGDDLVLVWEYDDFVIQASLWTTCATSDHIMGGSINMSSYESLQYYPKENWATYWSNESYKDYVDMLIYDDYAEIYERPNAPTPTPEPKNEPIVLPEGQYDVNLPNDILMEYNGQTTSLLQISCEDLVALFGEPTTTYESSKEYMYDFFDKRYVSFQYKRYDKNSDDTRICTLKIDNQNLQKVPKISLMGLNKDSTYEDVYKIFGNPHSMYYDDDDDYVVTLCYGGTFSSSKDYFFNDNMELAIRVTFEHNKLVSIALDFIYLDN